MKARGTAPRIYKNTLVFLAADRARLADLDEAVRYYLAWNSIVEESEKVEAEPQLNLDANQRRQAKTQRDNATPPSTRASRRPTNGCLCRYN